MPPPPPDMLKYDPFNLAVTMKIRVRSQKTKTSEYDQEMLRSKCQYLIRHQGYRTFFMLNPTEHEIYHAHKC